MSFIGFERIGTTRYGTTKFLDEHWYVSTAFFFIWYFPLIPVESQIVKDLGNEKSRCNFASESERPAVNIGWHGPSILHGYIRAWGAFGGPAFAVLLPKMGGDPVLSFPLLLASWATAAYSYWGCKYADLEDAAEFLAEYVDSDEELPEWVLEPFEGGEFEQLEEFEVREPSADETEDEDGREELPRARTAE